jgi:hypothetical protein
MEKGCFCHRERSKFSEDGKCAGKYARYGIMSERRDESREAPFDLMRL